MDVERMTVDGIGTVVRQTGNPDSSEAVVFLHGNPGSGADWTDLLEATGPLMRSVAWDAPGFGQADKPGDFPHTLEAHAAYIEAVLGRLGISRVHLVTHDFGGPWGLTWVAAQPDRLASLVFIDTGLLLGYRWHLMARLWRTPVLGELSMLVTPRRGFQWLIGRWGNPRGLPAAFISRMYDDYDRDTRKAVLRLYRNLPDPAGVSAAGAPLLEALAPPALIVWGAHDPYIPVAQAHVQKKLLPHADLVILPDSGHWPFADAPDDVRTAITAFISVPRPPEGRS